MQGKIKIIDFSSWLRTHIQLLEESKLAALMQCRSIKQNNELILCNIGSLPDICNKSDIINIISGKHIKL